VLDEITLLGSRYVNLDELYPAITLVAEGYVEMVVSGVKRLEAVNEVYEALERGSAIGRIVLDVAGVT
jgi:D-arabinose 1-dehydrogenase-like Zn-dependent alcohol dehydrogenase